MIEAVLFDLDDTLHDRSQSLGRFVADQHHRLVGGRIALDVYVDRFVALDAGGHLAKAALYPRLLSELAVGDLDPAAMAQDYDDYFHAHAVAMPGALDLLQVLRGRALPTAIVSNGWTGFQHRTIDALGLKASVDAILISEQESLRKPDRRLFLRAAERLGAAPGDCLFVGDNPLADILGAHDAGMQTAWLRRGFAWPDDRPNPGIAIDTLSAIPALLDD